MREVFDKYDDNESGKLDHKELLSAIKDLGLAGDTERAKDLLMRLVGPNPNPYPNPNPNLRINVDND